MKIDLESTAGQAVPEQTAPSTAASAQQPLAEDMLDKVSGGAIIAHEIIDIERK